MTEIARIAVELDMRDNGSFYCDAAESCLSPNHNLSAIGPFPQSRLLLCVQQVRGNDRHWAYSVEKVDLPECGEISFQFIGFA